MKQKLFLNNKKITTMKILSILLSGQYKSGGEAMLVGLLSGALIYGISYVIRQIKKQSEK